MIGRTRDARSFTTNPMAFLDYQLAQDLSPDELGGQTTFIIVKLKPWADANAVRKEIESRLPYNDVHTKAEWASISRRYWIESTGLGLTIFLTVSLGALVGVVIVAQTLYASTTEHLAEFGTIKALGGRDMDVYGLIGEQAMFAAAFGFSLGLALTFGLGPLMDQFDMKMSVSPTLAALVFVGNPDPLPVGLDTLSAQGPQARPGHRFSRGLTICIARRIPGAPSLEFGLWLSNSSQA